MVVHSIESTVTLLDSYVSHVSSQKRFTNHLLNVLSSILLTANTGLVTQGMG
jgi:hypothetical protein